MKKTYPKLERGGFDTFAKTLKKDELKLIEEYLVYRKARGLKTEENFKSINRVLLQFRYILEKPLKEMDLKDLRELLSIINNSDMSNHYRNIVKAHLKNFLKFVFPDWSIRFSNLDDIKGGQVSLNEEKINHKTLLTKEDIEKMVKAETTNRWRAFLLTQFEGGLRTKEARFLKWSDIKIDVDENLTEINIFATKTSKARTIYVREATHYIKLLKQEQENLKDKGIYVFHAKNDSNKPIAKYSVNRWFSQHSKKVLGRECWNYLLRHSRATELYSLAEENKISKDVAIRFMGHNEDMSKVYKHPNPNDIKKMLKDQVYHIEDLPEERKHDLELKMERLQKQFDDKEKEYLKQIQNIKHELHEQPKTILKQFKQMLKNGELSL